MPIPVAYPLTRVYSPRLKGFPQALIQVLLDELNVYRFAPELPQEYPSNPSTVRRGDIYLDISTSPEQEAAYLIRKSHRQEMQRRKDAGLHP